MKYIYPGFVLLMLGILVMATYQIGFQEGLKANKSEQYTCVLIRK